MENGGANIHRWLVFVFEKMIIFATRNSLITGKLKGG